MISLLLHNIRSVHNVGSLLRSGDGFGVERVIFSGYTPYPELPHDKRLPHLRRKLTEALHKTALGAENSLSLDRVDDPLVLMSDYAANGYRLVGLEQDQRSQLLNSYQPHEKTLLILGEEVDGINQEMLAACHDLVEIPMRGDKESFNVSVAGAIAMYALTSKA